MRVGAVLLGLVAACSRGQPTSAPSPWSSVVAAPIARVSSMDVDPAELGDDDALARMRHRVRLKRHGRAWLRGDVPPISDTAGSSDDDPIDELLPAIGESGSRIRVVTEEDGARVAVWIERRDAWESIVAPVKVDVGGSGRGAAGVWLEAGAPIAVARARLPAARWLRSIELRDEVVELRGSVPSAFIGHVWTVPHDDAMETAMAGSCGQGPWRPPPDRWPHLELGEGAVIRAAAGSSATELATLREVLDVAVLGRDAGWAEVELRRPYVRIRGHVPASELDTPGAYGFLSGSCSGRGFGMSHADRIEVPAGACLYDRANGEIAGVAIEAQVRLGERGRAGDEWSMVYVDTRWSIASLYVRDTGSDPAQPAFESCTSGRHRR